MKFKITFIATLFFASSVFANQDGCLKALENKSTIVLAEEHRVLQEKLSLAVNNDDFKMLRELISSREYNTQVAYKPFLLALRRGNPRAIMILTQNLKTDINIIRPRLILGEKPERSSKLLLMATERRSGGLKQQVAIFGELFFVPLVEAMKNPDADFITWILLSRNDVDINAQDHNGITPLEAAFTSKNKEAASLILERDDLTLTHERGDTKTPGDYLALAINTINDPEIIDTLLSHYEMNRDYVVAAISKVRYTGRKSINDKVAQIDEGIMNLLQDYILEI